MNLNEGPNILVSNDEPKITQAGEAAAGEVKDLNSRTPELCCVVQQPSSRENAFLPSHISLWPERDGRTSVAHSSSQIKRWVMQVLSQAGQLSLGRLFPSFLWAEVNFRVSSLSWQPLQQRDSDGEKATRVFLMLGRRVSYLSTYYSLRVKITSKITQLSYIKCFLNTAGGPWNLWKLRLSGFHHSPLQGYSNCLELLKREHKSSDPHFQMRESLSPPACAIPAHGYLFFFCYNTLTIFFLKSRVQVTAPTPLSAWPFNLNWHICTVKCQTKKGKMFIIS